MPPHCILLVNTTNQAKALLDRYQYGHFSFHCFCLSALSFSLIFLSSKAARRTIISKRLAERQYWAKGTGFGTGSTSSSWDMDAMIAHQQSKELLVTLCLAIMAEYLQGMEGKGDGGLPPAGLLNLLSSSCLLPALATCLMNDSGKLCVCVCVYVCVCMTLCVCV